jgi:hypothetical protein
MTIYQKSASLIVQSIINHQYRKRRQTNNVLVRIDDNNVSIVNGHDDTYLRRFVFDCLRTTTKREMVKLDDVIAKAIKTGS